MRSRAVGLLLGHVADRAFGDPRRHHPVAGLGKVAQVLEDHLYADSRVRGIVHTVVLVGGGVVVGTFAERAARRPAHHALVTAIATWAVLGGRSLEREALAVHGHLLSGDLEAARLRLTHLVGRDPAGLDASEISRAVAESVAENTADAVVAPLVWGAAAGVPGLLAYRVANTLDAMVGHHNPRYEQYGWASARFDDLMNLPGSRLSAALVLAARPGEARAAWRAWRRDAAGHPSPNAGVVEAAFAGSLGLTLGGLNRYGERVERRATMGHGRPPQPRDIHACIDLARRVDHLAVAVAILLAGRGRDGLRSAKRSPGSR